MKNFVVVPLLGAALLVVGALPKSAHAQPVTQPIVELVDLTVDSVELVEGQLVANLVVTLDVVGNTITRELQVPLDLTATPGEPGECPILHLSLGPVNLDVLGLHVDLDDCAEGPVVVDIVADPAGGLLGSLLCGIANLLNDPELPLDLGAILGGLSPEDQATVLTGLTDLLNGVLDQLLMTSAVSEQVGVASHQAGCDILMLELGELDLDLLGLEVHTSEICLHVYAERGPGNLLGNLLCGVANLLDNNGNNQGGVAALVRNITRLIDRLGL
jgi:hypothetical protein